MSHNYEDYYAKTPPVSGHLFYYSRSTQLVKTWGSGMATYVTPGLATNITSLKDDLDDDLELLLIIDSQVRFFSLLVGDL